MASWHRGRFDPVARGPDPLTVQLFSSLLPARQPANATPLRLTVRTWAHCAGAAGVRGPGAQQRPEQGLQQAHRRGASQPEVLQRYLHAPFSSFHLLFLSSLLCACVCGGTCAVLCAGIGNYLRAEVLARAGVSPHLTATQLFTDPQYQYEDPSSSSNAVITRRSGRPAGGGAAYGEGGGTRVVVGTDDHDLAGVAETGQLSNHVARVVLPEVLRGHHESCAW